VEEHHCPRPSKSRFGTPCWIGASEERGAEALGVEEAMHPLGYQRILAVARQAAGPVMARQVGEVLGVDVKCGPSRKIAAREAGQTRRQRLAAQLPDGRFTTRLRPGTPPPGRCGAAPA
jgi:hypothetical protein